MPESVAGAQAQGGIPSACQQALVEAAREAGAGTRQQRRAAARRFVRRHRRDASYLCWVLRSVAASSALAVTLLGLGAEPARADATLFTELTGAANPLDGETVGGGAAPSLGDLDGDGDLDLLAGETYGTFRYYENTGSATSPAFVERTGTANPLDGEDVGFVSAPALSDVDGDGDLDLVAGEIGGAFLYYQNTGSATSPAFIERTGAANPFPGGYAGTGSAPVLVDLDGDGDLDLVSGEAGGGFLYFENVGSATNPGFSLRTGAANPLDGEDVGYYSAPALADLDGDGDLDLMAGKDGGVIFYENTGSATSPAFIERTGAIHPLDGENLGSYPRPAFGDLDGDGDSDLVLGQGDGTFRYYKNLSGRLVSRTGAANPLLGQDVGYSSAPELGDLDGDGDLDLVAGELYGLRYYENTGSATDPAFIERTGAANPLSGHNLGYDLRPALGDLDGDGDLDLVAGEGGGALFYLENTGNAASPAFIERTGTANPLAGRDVGFNSTPTLGDLDDDGDLDLIAGQGEGAFFYFENTGSATSPTFVERTGTANPLDGEDVGYTSTPELGDLDGDGDLDITAGENLGAFLYYENTGSTSSPAFVQRVGAANPLDAEDVGDQSKPALGDLDGDGDLDLLAGDSYGTFHHYENAIVDPAPKAHERTGASNPLTGDIGYTSAPELGDLDGDGDLDLVAGETYGTFLYYENTGSATSPAFVERTGAANPLDGEHVGAYNSTTALGDLDGDGDLDLIGGNQIGRFLYYENTGSATSPAFLQRTGAANPLDAEDVAFNSRSTLGDLDGDGDLDLVAGEGGTTLNYYENTGNATSPAFVQRTGVANPLDGQANSNYSSPVLGDLDGDGDLDLVVGERFGSFLYYENTGSLTSPAFVFIDPHHAFSGKDVGDWAAPTLGDLDADGDLDLVAGQLDGTFTTFYLPEPGQGWMLAAGLALLKLLERWRSRRQG